MKKISRRSFLKASAVLGSAAALTACGGSSASTSCFKKKYTKLALEKAHIL